MAVISFSLESVRLILAHKKTQARRVVSGKAVIGGRTTDAQEIQESANIWLFRKPYRTDELMWVREPWRVIGWREHEPLLIEYRDGACREENVSQYSDDDWVESWYERMIRECAQDCERANVPYDGHEYCLDDAIPTRWRSSRLMPKGCARLWLRITDVRVERLQHISHADAIAEGVTKAPIFVYGSRRTTTAYYADYADGLFATPQAAFRDYWDRLNASRGFSWRSNPWVWVVSFKHA